MEVELDQTRKEIRDTMRKWHIYPSEFEILWEESTVPGMQSKRLPGAIFRYMRNGIWQTVTCAQFANRGDNLRQIFFLLDRLRKAEKFGVQYVALTSTKEVIAVNGASERERRLELLDAYDILGISPDDPTELIERTFRTKSMYYHPDKGGNPEKFKRLAAAYDLVMKAKGLK